VGSMELAIESFRSAAVMPSHWPAALDALAQVLHSDGATLVLKHTTVDSIAVSSSVKPFVPRYFNCGIQDPRESRAMPDECAGFMPDHALFSDREIARDPYYQEFLKPSGFGWNAVAALQGELDISFKRGFRRGAYDGSDLADLDRALPFLRAASRAALLTWRSHFDGQLSAFDKLGRGALLIDATGKVLRINSCVHFGDGLDLVNGQLLAARPADRDALSGFLARVLAGAQRDATAPTLTLARPSGARPWLLDGICCPAALRSLHSEAAGLVLITDLDKVESAPALRLQRLFGLTAREAELAARLAAGETLTDAARRLHISPQHARQRLQAVFGKTGTSRQVDLVLLLARSR